MYHWRALIGLITPNSPNAEMAFHQFLPEGVAVNSTKISFRGPTEESLYAMDAQLEKTAALFTRHMHDIVVFACTAGSFIGGKGYDQELIKTISAASGTKAITTSTAVLEAFQELGVSKPVMVAPYPDSVNAAEVKFFADNGIEITALGKFSDFEEGGQIGEISTARIYQKVKSLDLSRADSIFLSCTGLDAFESIPYLERDFGLPVITSNQASLWAALRHIGIGDKIPELGLLLTEH